MLRFYGDESVDDPLGFTVVAGYVASVNQWQQFEMDWRIMLARFQVPYFHMKELAHFKGPFEKWKDASGTRAKFLACAADVINCNIKHGASAYIHHKDWQFVDARYELHENLRSPYALAGRACVADVNVARMRQFQVDKIGIDSAKDLDIEYIFEEGAPDEEGLRAAIKFPKPQFPNPIFKPSVDTGAKKGLIQLQSADFLAYETRKFARDYHYHRRKKKPRRSLLALTESQVDRQFGTIERLIEFCGRCGIKQRMIESRHANAEGQATQ